jgi:hypothetical protein
MRDAAKLDDVALLEVRNVVKHYPVTGGVFLGRSPPSERWTG